MPGTIKELKVKRFQRVVAGEEIAVITTVDPEAVQASLRAIEADLKLMRARMQLDVDRNNLSYQQTRLEYMKERVALNIERVNGLYYDAQVVREQQLMTNVVPTFVDGTTLEFWLRLASTTHTNVLETGKYLAEKEKTLPSLVPAPLADDAILEDIKAQEEKLRATEQMISLKSPIDGMVSLVEHLQGERIVQNLPIVTISAVQATRIIGYARKPYSEIPKVGDSITIRRQTFKREVAQGVVTEVSGQLEQITPTLFPPAAGVKIELGLPFAVSIPAELAATLIPGEPVDLIFSKK